MSQNYITPMNPARDVHSGLEVTELSPSAGSPAVAENTEVSRYGSHTSAPAGGFSSVPRYEASNGQEYQPYNTPSAE